MSAGAMTVRSGVAQSIAVTARPALFSADVLFVSVVSLVVLLLIEASLIILGLPQILGG